MKKFIFISIFIIPLTLFAEVNLKPAYLSVKRDIEKSTYELNKLRDEISSERIKSSEEFENLKEEVFSLRKEYEGIREKLKEENLEKISEELSYLENDVKFTSSLIKEFRREMGKALIVPKIKEYSSSFKEIDKILEKSPIEAVSPLLRLVRKTIDESKKPDIFEGNCLDDEGIYHKGKFIVFGPISYFYSKDISGIVGINGESALPMVVYPLRKEKLMKLLNGEYTLMPLDISMGEAIKVEKFRKNWKDYIISGGIVMIPILGLGFLCFIIIIWKFFSLSRMKIGESATKEIADLVKENKFEEATEKIKLLGRPLSPILSEIIEHRSATREDIEEITHERVLSQLPFLQSHLSTLAVSASASPLLGLLGTVTGMIHTFNLVTLFGTGQAKLLSGGISEALITTEFGLAIAIPVLLIHAYFSRKVRKIIDTLELETLSLINAIKGMK